LIRIYGRPRARLVQKVPDAMCSFGSNGVFSSRNTLCTVSAGKLLTLQINEGATSQTYPCAEPLEECSEERSSGRSLSKVLRREAFEFDVELSDMSVVMTRSGRCLGIGVLSQIMELTAIRYRLN
jgi:hypothetical protein